MAQQPRGKIQTVTGSLDPRHAGITLMHEHIFVNLAVLVHQPQDPKYQERMHQKVEMRILGWLRNYPFESFENMKLLDEEVAIREVLNFKAIGGSTIVDLTPPDIGRDTVGLRKVATLTRLNIVCGTAHYIGAAHPGYLSDKSEKEIAEEFVKEIRSGIGDTGVKAGIIGEIGNSWPWLNGEKKCCKAAAMAQAETGASISIHPGRSRESPLEIIKFLKEETNLSRVILGHAETRLSEVKEFETIADYGACVELDTFGLDRLHFGESPSDRQRVKLLTRLIDDGYAENVLISHDVCMKIQLTRYGGYGYGHILENILPYIREEGVSDHDVRQILIENPKRLLTFE